jgi:hypothetical protein
MVKMARIIWNRKQMIEALNEGYEWGKNMWRPLKKDIYVVHTYQGHPTDCNPGNWSKPKTRGLICRVNKRSKVNWG